MRIVKECSLVIKSRIENLTSAGLPEGDIERSESRVRGFYHYDSEGSVLLTYTEESEGGRADGEILVSDGEVRVRRSGAYESDFSFKMGVLHRSLYKVNPYSFDAEILPKRVRTLLTENGGEIDLFYNMKSGGADKAVRMKIEISCVKAEASV